MFIEHAIQILKSHGQKITKTRVWLLHQLDAITKPINPYEFLKHADGGSAIDVTTIYRNLELFELLWIVHKVHSLWWYMPCLHHHKDCDKVHDLIVCTDCNSISEIHIPSETKKTLWLGTGSVELSGHCISCEQKK